MAPCCFWASSKLTAVSLCSTTLSQAQLSIVACLLNPTLHILSPQVYELSEVALDFLTRQFRLYDDDVDGLLTWQQLERMYSTVPPNIWQVRNRRETRDRSGKTGRGGALCCLRETVGAQVHYSALHTCLTPPLLVTKVALSACCASG